MVHVTFAGKIVFVGFGSIGQGVLPLILRHIGTHARSHHHRHRGRQGAQRSRTIRREIRQDRADARQLPAGAGAAAGQGRFPAEPVGRRVERRARQAGARTRRAVSRHLHRAVGRRLHRFACQRGFAQQLHHAPRGAGAPQGAKNAPTAVLTHGANPGLVSHMVKQALLNIAKDTGVDAGKPASREAWAKLAQTLGIKVMHVAERDTQVTNVPKQANEFVNTWSVDGFVSEGAQPAELGWGTSREALPGRRRASHRGLGLRNLLESSRRQHPGAHLDPQGGTFPRISDHAFRSHLLRRLLHGDGRGARGIPADQPLCLSPQRQCGAVGARICRQQLASAGSQTHHAERNHRRHRRARGAARRTHEERLLVRLAAIDRGGA